MTKYDWDAHLNRSAVYADSSDVNKALIRRIVLHIFQHYAINPEPSARHKWEPSGITLAFPDCPFATIEMRKQKYGVKLRLTGTVSKLRELGAPDEPRAKNGVGRASMKTKGFVRVYIDDPADVEPALRWIDASARLKGLNRVR